MNQTFEAGWLFFKKNSENLQPHKYVLPVSEQEERLTSQQQVTHYCVDVYLNLMNKSLCVWYWENISRFLWTFENIRSGFLENLGTNVSLLLIVVNKWLHEDFYWTSPKGWPQSIDMRSFTCQTYLMHTQDHRKQQPNVTSTWKNRSINKLQ